MTQEEKKLLLKDLCARLPYEPHIYIKTGKAYIKAGKADADTVLNGTCIYNWMTVPSYQNITIKPYLRPMSSMTEEEKKEFESLGWRVDELDGNTPWNHNAYNVFDGVDWLNKKMFDYRGLIPMGLALKAKEGMYD